MASLIKIKRSGINSVPSNLGAGELAYSWASDKLYVGTGSEDINGNAANIDVIGGKFYTNLLSATPGTLSTGKAVVVDSNGKIDQLTIGNLKLSNNLLESTSGDINITPYGSNKTVVTNLYINNAGQSLHDYIQTVSGGSLVDSSEIDITFDSGAGTTSLLLKTTGVTPGSYGSATAIPTFTVDDKGRLTNAGSVNVATSLSIAGDTGTDTISLLSDTLSILGGEGIDVAVSTGTITISGEDASTTNKGVASFNSASFDVASGAVSIKNAGVTNTQLVNSDVTIGTSTVSLGGTITSVLGLTELSVDNLNINGNEIQSTNANGNIVLNPNGTGQVDVASSRIINLLEPVNPSDAATKNYVDNAVTGLTWKVAVNLLVNSNIALTGNTNTLSIDGHSTLTSVHSGYRLLLVNQNSSTDNGIYVYNDNGTTYSLTRSTDADTYQELIGASVWVIEGTTYASTGWTQSNQYLSGFTGQNWVQFSGAGAYTAGPGLGQSGTEFFVQVATNGGIEIVSDELRLKSTVAGAGLNYTNGVLDVNVDSTTLEIVSDTLRISQGYTGQSSITTLGTITTGTWNGNLITTTYGGTGFSSYAGGDLLYGKSTGSLTKLSIGTVGQVLQVSASGTPVWGDIDGGTY